MPEIVFEFQIYTDKYLLHRFSEQDILMRYHLGLGIGHVGIHGPPISIPAADSINLMNVDSDFNSPSQPSHHIPSNIPVDVDDSNALDPPSDDEDSNHGSGIDSDEEDPNKIQLEEERYHSDGQDSLSEYDD